MKTITIIEIEGHQIICGINNTQPDPAETNKKVEALINKNSAILLTRSRDELLAENIVFSRPGSGQQNVEDDIGNNLLNILETLDPHERLLLSGDIIADWRDAEYWLEKSGSWIKQKIEHLGEIPPEDAVFPDKLSQSQQQEIAEQTEAERIASLDPEQKIKEKEGVLAAALREVRNLKEEAEIAGEPFDAKAEYELRKQKIDEKYA
jgi:hypothetical protein